MKTVIKIENLSKAYQLGQFSTGTLSRDFQRWLALTRGKEDPFLKIGEKNDRTEKGSSDIVWSLKDLNIEIGQGEAVGIIGRNGAGKSTLLKILSRVTSPTEGSIKLKGRVASLLEVGTGFHPELSGRENIFLNGAILGMSQREVKSKFDEIVNFAGVERYIDTPVKRYSSGMYVRLAFAVAAHLDSEILIVDEVLAVGDAEFQKKCIGKMGELGELGNRTILFVSHNMASLRALCQKGVYMVNGEVVQQGAINEVVATYLSSSTLSANDDGSLANNVIRHGTNDGEFKRILLQKENSENGWEFYFREKIKMKVDFEAYRSLFDVVLSVYLTNVYGEKIGVFLENQNYKPITLDKGMYQLSFEVDQTILPGSYVVGLSASYAGSGTDVDYVESAGKLKVLKESLEEGRDYPWTTSHGYMQFSNPWTINKID
jgi:lipopolysaccharide transport system ATP-binding protein